MLLNECNLRSYLSLHSFTYEDCISFLDTPFNSGDERDLC